MLYIHGYYALVNQIPHYPPPRLMRGFDKGIEESPFPQGGAFDMSPFDLWLKVLPNFCIAAHEHKIITSCNYNILSQTVSWDKITCIESDW